MSLILDALRKSEAERRRSETPDLLAAVSTAPPPQTRRSPAIPTRTVAIAASAALMLALVFWLGWRSRDDAGSVDGMPPDATRTAGTAGVADDTGDRASATPASSIDGGTIAATDATAEVAVAPPVPVPPPQVPAAPPGAATMPSSPAYDPVDPPASLPSPNAQAGVVSRPAPVATAPVPSPPMPSPPGGAMADAGAPLAPSQLGAETRRQMPPLKMSMHLWNEAASQRFVVLDGQRLGEGDVVGDVVVERIDRDAVIVVWRGERVRLPVR